MPADYVNKLARMFQDVKVSEDLNQHFKDVHRNKASLAGKFIMIYFKYILCIFSVLGFVTGCVQNRLA